MNTSAPINVRRAPTEEELALADAMSSLSKDSLHTVEHVTVTAEQVLTSPTAPKSDGVFTLTPWQQLADEIKRWPVVKISIKAESMRMSFKSHVFISDEILTIFHWSSSGLDLDLEPSGARIWEIEVNGMPYRAMYFGSQVKIGLLATITSFMLVNDQTGAASE